MVATKPKETPMKVNQKLKKDPNHILQDITSYRRMIGRLLCLTNTRLDITFVVGRLTQFLSCPSKEHFNTAIRVLKNNKKSPREGLFFSANSLLHLVGYNDSDWGPCMDSRRSITGYCFFLAYNLVAWKSKKQQTPSCSFSEDEYRALAHATCEAQWLLYIIRDLGVQHSGPATILCDNKSAIHITTNPFFLERTKHIDLDCYVVRDKLEK
jgi:hypothetical protein